MRCSKAKRYISDYIDGLLNAKQVEKLESHLDECEPCRDLYAYMKSMVKEAKQSEWVSPKKDLWPSIRKQIVDDDMTDDVRLKVKRFFTGFSRYRRELAFSATAFFAGVILMTLFYYGLHFIQTDSETPDRAAINQFNEIEYHYQQAINVLNKAIAEQNVKLSPELASVFKENLEIIDNSIRTFRAAIEKHPGDPDATEYLMICYRKKLELLGEMKDLMMQAG